MRPTARQSAPITMAQIKLVHALRRALLLDDDLALWQGLLYERFKVISSKELDKTQAASLIDEMQNKAIELGLWEKREDKRQRFNKLAGRPDMASPEQLRKIEAMWQEISHAPEGPERVSALRGFIARIAKVSDLRFLDQDGAGKVLNALKAMQTKEQNPKKPKTRKKAI